MSIKKEGQIIIVFALAAVLVFFGILLWEPLNDLLSDMEKLRATILGLGYWGPLVIIALSVLQVLVAPVPGQMTGLVSGYIFGALFGTIYSMAGLVLGSLLAFTLSRKFGKPLVKKLVREKTIDRFDAVVMKHGKPALFLVYLLPTLPDDAICYIAGLTKIRISSLVLLSFLGRLPGFIVLNMVGSGLAAKNSLMSLMIFLAFAVVSVLIFVNRKALEKKLESIV